MFVGHGFVVVGLLSLCGPGTAGHGVFELTVEFFKCCWIGRRLCFAVVESLFLESYPLSAPRSTKIWPCRYGRFPQTPPCWRLAHHTMPQRLDLEKNINFY